MEPIEIITRPVQAELKQFDILYKQALEGHNVDFQFLIDFIASKNGKRIRPLTLFLSAKLCGKPNPATLDYAVILELLHTATLLHDDVVDNTMERRNQPSVNAVYDNRTAVLLGDYILSQAIIRGIASRNHAVLTIMGELSQNLVDGELTQLNISNEIIIDEKRYFDVIRKKTAILLASCSEVGAISVNATPEEQQNLRLIGENLGLCFQIRDDIFDYFEQGEIGKPTGNDIREGKITLPLLHALQTAPPNSAEEMMKIIEKRAFSSENITQLIAFAKEYDGITYAQEKMLSIKAETLQLLDQFEDSEAKTAFRHLINYIIERQK